MVPLVVRSHYSLMRGTASVRRLARAARRMGYERLALTDTDNLYGLWPFLSACREEGLTPMVGAEVTEPAHGRSAVCLVETDEGYRNLCRLLTRRHLNPEEFDLAAALPADAAGLTVLTADPGLLAALAAAGVAAAAMLRRPLPAGHPLRVAAARAGAPVVAVPDSVCLAADELALHRILRAIAGNTCLSRLAAADCAPPDAWLAPPAAYAERFATLPRALHATAEIAARLTFTGPRFGTVLPPLAGHDEASAAARLRAAAYAGAHRRYGGELAEAVVERLEHELALIGQMGFAAYFLIVRDIVRLSPRTCGRGSGAASLVAYCLGITNVCPLKHNLYFERFLNPGRTDPPDIDVDFAWDERDAVLAAVLARHRGHAAMVANHVLFQPRMAVREVAKVYGLLRRPRSAGCPRACPGTGTPTRSTPTCWICCGGGPRRGSSTSRRPGRRSCGSPGGWSAPRGTSRCTPAAWSSPRGRSTSTCRSSAPPRGSRSSSGRRTAPRTRGW